MNDKTDIIISVRGTREHPIEQDFQHCIETLVLHTSNYRLIFVDDNSDAIGAQVVDGVAARFPDSVLLRTHKQNWFTRAYNKGLRLVRTPRAVLLNADTILGQGWLDELYECWNEAQTRDGARVGLVGSTISDPELRRWAYSRYPGYVTGHCWLVSMQALYDVSAARGQPGWYLDETRLENAHIRSDVELCWRLQELGYATIASFKSSVNHIGGRSWGYNLGAVNSIRWEDIRDL